MALPQPGDIIRTNYNSGPYRVTKVICKDGTYCFVCIHATHQRVGTDYWLGGFKLLSDGRVQKPVLLLPGSSGYNSIAGHIDDEFRQDEIFIVSTSYEELPLFAVGALPYLQSSSIDNAPISIDKTRQQCRVFC